MKKCKSCMKEIDAKAKKCPFCQADQRNWFLKHPVITGLLVLFVIGMIASAGGSKKTTTTASNGTESTVAPTPMKITARQLADDFDSNKVAAENTWKGKVVEFSGVVSNITDNGLSFYNIASKPGSLSQISCRVTDKQQLLSLKNGETVTVRGVVGSQTIGVIDGSDCEVVK